MIRVHTLLPPISTIVSLISHDVTTCGGAVEYNTAPNGTLKPAICNPKKKRSKRQKDHRHTFSITYVDEVIKYM